MSVIIGSARNGENGTTGNKAGDQSGSEVSTQTFYVHSKGWYGFTPKDNTVAEKLAQAMQDACDNNCIGYDQGDRDTLLTQYKAYGSIKAIKTNCECDCSSLVRVCIYQATGILLSDFDTSGEASVLAASGLFKDKVSVTSASQCTLGMVLVTKTKGHTAIIVSGASLGGEDTAVKAQPDTVWNYLYKKIGNAYGAAGLMGNLYAESGLLPNNLQDSYEKKLGYTDVTYTEAVDDGKYTKFASDSAGYGLAQWTYKTRKQALYDYCTSMKSSIGDLDCQLEFLIAELQADFASVWKSLKNATSVKEASDIVLTKFEQPADQSDSVKTKRANYGQNYYDTYVGGSSSSGSTSSDKLTVDGEIGSKTVIRSQKFFGITQDGFIDGQPSSGKQYWPAVLSSVCKWSGGKSDTVRASQKYLRDKGYSIGVNFVDGKAGKNTAKAWQTFLSDKGFYKGAIDSIFGVESAKAYQSWLNSYN